MPVKDFPEETPSEKKQPSVDLVAERNQEIKAKLNERYKALVERLNAEPNVILRYEIKLSLDELMNTYRIIFPEG